MLAVAGSALASIHAPDIDGSLLDSRSARTDPHRACKSSIASLLTLAVQMAMLQL